MKEDPIRILITGAGGQIGYSIAYRIANGELHTNKRIILHLYGLEKDMELI